MPRNSSGSMVPANGPYIVGTVADPTLVNARFADEEAEIGSSLDRTGRGGMLAPVRAADGTVAAPAYSFTSEVGTGAYRAGASDYRIALAGVDKAIVTAAGLAIGAPNPNATLSLSAPGQLVIGFIETTGAAGNMRANLVYDAGAALGVPGLVLQNVSDAGVFAGNTLMLQRDGLVRLLNTTAIQPASMVTNPALGAGWTVTNGATPGYWKDATGHVHLRGQATFATGAAGLFAQPLPAGFRPAVTRRWVTWEQISGIAATVLVDAAGNVALSALSGGALTNGAELFLDVVTYLAEA